MRILCVIESYLPGVGGGGPVRALVNWARWARAGNEIFIFTRHRDYLASAPYSEVGADAWTICPVTGARVWYASAPAPFPALRDRVREVAPDWIYLHGALPPLVRGLLLRRRFDHTLGAVPILLAPHGNLAPATLARRPARKGLWLALARALGLYDGLRWHAASEREAAQIGAVFWTTATDIRIVPMAPELEGFIPETGDRRPEGGDLRAEGGDRRAEGGDRKPEGGDLRLVYFGRVSPEKNLGFAIDILAEIAARPDAPAVSLEIVGPDQEGELDRLRERIAAARPAPRVIFTGALAAEALRRRLASGEWHALLLPSLSENFSYAVLEALQAGLRVLVSDQTPWRGLGAAGVGRDLALTDKGEWARSVQELAGETSQERERGAARARDYARAWVAGYAERANALFSA